jgi:hypothetical protein
MDIAKIDTSKLKFDPQDSDFLRFFDPYPEFKIDWLFKIPRKVFLTYVVLMYDPRSELIEKFPNFWSRKRIAAEIAGFPICRTGERKGLFDEEEEAILLGGYRLLNRMCIRYCLLFHDIEYLTLISYLEIFIQETMRVMELNDTKDSKVLIANIDNLNIKIRQLSENVFGGRETEDMKKELYKLVINERLAIRPELIAKSLKDMVPPITSPYEQP